MLILTDQEFKEIRTAAEAARTPNGPQAMRAIMDIVARHNAANIGRVKELLNENIDALIAEINDILADGKLTVGDLGNGIKLFSILSGIAKDWPELKAELLYLNELEQQLLGIELIKIINKHIL